MPVDAERSRRVEELFASTVRLDPAAREAFLDRVCPDDPELRAEVVARLARGLERAEPVTEATRDPAHRTSAETAETAAYPRQATTVAGTPGSASPEPRADRLAPGARLTERYRIVHLLGRGGMGQVYRAEDLQLGQDVALKILSAAAQRDPKKLSLLINEVKLSRQITHPNVCRVHDLRRAGDLHFISMEFIDGEDLASLLRRIGRLHRDKALDIAVQICDGLAAAHRLGILHRDLKPANLMIDSAGNARITDFGLAAIMGQVRDSQVLLGTPAYMAPEQLIGQEVSAKSDLWALGLVLYELFTGRMPFDASSAPELVSLQRTAPTPPTRIVEGFHPAVERIILRCLRYQAERRPESPAEVAAVLRSAGEETAPGWRPSSDLEIPGRPHWRLQKKLSQGGFGEVWLAGHTQTRERRAYKFCFEAERLRSLQREITVFRLLQEELGECDNIARILDWNLDRPPYFIESAYTEGGNLVDWAAEQGGITEVPLADRLEIVAQVAMALAAAHSVGVLHKDVKPRNVLSAAGGGGRPRAVLTDFGIGEITERERLADRSITVLGLTELATGSDRGTSGTRLYLAPEVVAGKAPTIQADVYALGVMLFQLTVGDFDRFPSPGWERDVDDELLAEDIACFVDSSPERRPGNAREVAERLRRLEERRAAREDERAAREAAKTARRRRRLVTLVAAVSTVFLIVVSVLAFQALRARDDAKRGREQAEQLIDFMLGDLHESLEKSGRLDLLAEVARGSKGFFDTLSERDEPADAAYNRGITLLNIGDVLLDQGDAEAARGSYQSALELFEARAVREPARPEWRRGRSLSRLKLGEVLGHQGDTAPALATLQTALAEAESLAAADPGHPGRGLAVARAHFQLARLQSQTGERESALEAARTAAAMAEDLTRAPGPIDWRVWLLLLDARILVGDVLGFHQELDAASEVYRDAQGLAERLATEDPTHALWPRRLARIHYQIGFVHWWRSDLAAALESFRSARDAYQRLTAADPTRVEWRAQLAQCLRLIARVHADLGEPGAGLELYRESLAILTRLVEEDPTRQTWRKRLGRLHQSIGMTHLELGETSSALESYRAAHALMEEIAASAGDDPEPQWELSISHAFLGDVYERRGELERARAEWARALEIIAPISSRSDDVMYRTAHAEVLLNLGRVDEARPLVEEVLGRGWSEPEVLQLVRDSGLGEILR